MPSGEPLRGEAARGNGSDYTSLYFVCTANRCRSPFAQAIAQELAGSRPFLFASAGLLPGGYAVPENGLAVAAERGLRLVDHVSTRVEPRSLARWDVVLTMSRGHARELVAIEPDLWPRVFTLRQFRRWLQAAGPPRHVTIGPWIRDVGADRSRSELVGANADDDVADPINEGIPAWREMADLLEEEITTVLDLISPRRRRRSR